MSAPLLLDAIYVPFIRQQSTGIQNPYTDQKPILKGLGRWNCAKDLATEH
jgi:hypothetical protein